MNSARFQTSGGNPFSAQQIRPGTIDYIFPGGTTAEQLVDKLRANRWRGAIVGAHGSGKSTLLDTLRPALEAAGRTVTSFELHDGERQLPTSLAAAGANSGGMVLVDGYEQLAWWSKSRLLWGCQRLGCGLLVTAHRPVTLPTLWETQTDLELAVAVVRKLISRQQTDGMEFEGEIARAFTSHNGNIRELLFELYDLYRARLGESGR